MENLSTLAGAFADNNDGKTLLTALKGVYDRLRCHMITSAGLVVTATSGKKVAKTGSAISYGIVKGRMFSIAAGVDMPALSGTVANATFNVFCIFANTADQALTAAGMTSKMGTAAATLEGVVFPAFPEGNTLIGFIIINPTGTGNFVGNTTDLEDATVAPGAIFVSPVGGFDPSATY